MTFFNKKTEVMQIEMTPYGRYLYSIGKLMPHSYEFVDDDILYRESYKNHPSTKWVRTNLYHYTWLWSLFSNLGKEFESRYNKSHTTIIKLRDRLRTPPRLIKQTEFVQPPQCMPDIYKQESSVDAYRAYYMGEKANFATWKSPSVIPSWWNKSLDKC